MRRFYGSCLRKMDKQVTHFNCFNCFKGPHLLVLYLIWAQKGQSWSISH